MSSFSCGSAGGNGIKLKSAWLETIVSGIQILGVKVAVPQCKKTQVNVV